jgi:hypothetical protein
MPLVVIQPSYGNPAARRHWKDTLDIPVDFTTDPRADLLTPDQRKQLNEFHPSGAARFWGATSAQDTTHLTARSAPVSRTLSPT